MATPENLPSTMRAAQWSSIAGGIEKNLTLNPEAKLPKSAHPLPKDHTLVKVAYASLNHLDYKPAEMPFGSTFIKKPATPGLDFSGTVVASSLPNLKPGQRVFGRTEPPVGGTLAEYVGVGKAGVAPVPDGVSLRDAACVGICGTAPLQSCAPYLEPGKKILINGGSGGVGVFAIQIAKAMGCSQVTAVCSGADADFCRRLGADEVIDYKAEDIVTALKRAGHQYDHILDTIFAKPELYWQCHHYLKPEGTYVDVGLPPQFKTFKTLFAIHLLPKWLGGGQRKFVFHSVSANAKDFGRVAQWIKEGKVKPVIEEEYSLEDAGKAYAKLKSGTAKGKLVVRVCGEPTSNSE